MGIFFGIRMSVYGDAAIYGKIGIATKLHNFMWKKKRVRRHNP